jgi:hypothetical protein
MACDLGVSRRTAWPGDRGGLAGFPVHWSAYGNPADGGLIVGAHPREDLVHLYDIKWPSIRSFLIQVLFT